MINEDLNKLKQFTSAIQTFTSGESEAFLSLWETFSAHRKQQITTAGDQEKYLYFVLEGVQRVYYYDEQGREATLVFTYPLSFGGVLDAMLTGQKSKYSYEAINHSKFLRASFNELQKLAAESPGVREMIFKGTSAALAGVLERLAELQCYSSEEKFRKLLHRSPHILQQVPQKYLANYLGIDPTNFSKLMNKVLI